MKRFFLFGKLHCPVQRKISDSIRDGVRVDPNPGLRNIKKISFLKKSWQNYQTESYFTKCFIPQVP